MNIVFFGTSVFAKEILKSLYENNHNILCVVTREDAKKDRGQKLLPPPVKVYALEHDICVNQIHTFKDNKDFESYFLSLPVDLVCVAAYGKIIPDYILYTPKYGALNVHGSLLPEYRGAAPIQRAIMDGKEELGITIMQMDSGLDTGDMIKKASIKISNEDNFETIQSSLANLGGKLLLDVVSKLGTSEEYPHTKQDDSLSTYANKICDEDKIVCFKEDAKKCFNRIRALYPENCAFVNLNDQKIKITKASYIQENSNGLPGSINALYAKGNGYIDVNTTNGILRILKLIPPGKGEMFAGDFIRGRKIFETDIFS